MKKDLDSNPPEAWQIFKIEKHYHILASCIVAMLETCIVIPTDLLPKYQIVLRNLCGKFDNEINCSDIFFNSLKSRRDLLCNVINDEICELIAEILLYHNVYYESDITMSGLFIHTYVPTKDEIKGFDWLILTDEQYLAENNEVKVIKIRWRFDFNKHLSLLVKAGSNYMHHCYMLDEAKKAFINSTIQQICQTL